MSRPHTRRTAAVCAAAAASVLLLASCGQDSDSHSADRATPTPQSDARSHAPSSPPEKVLVKQASAIVAGVFGGTLLEGGSERTGDGIHTRPVLRKGRTYQLALTCVGHGSARLTIVPSASGSDAKVPCDQSVVQRRIKGDGEVQIDVVGTKGATGVLAWQINTLQRPLGSVRRRRECHHR
ncbi:hypothetical protein [Streptomyces sp. NPDC020298]|uniref:hypothetical protein n=1 Tax=unclassified Streptomyces TaxID=2593676 RepID=UPI0033F3ECC8